MKSAEFPMMKELQSAAREQMSFYNKMMKEKEMNERIQELMKQSMVEYQFDMRFSPEKFAELLIEKCTSILSTIDRAQLRSGEYVDPADMIKQHFGVEE